MSVLPMQRSQVTLNVGGVMSATDRATLTQLLLEKGLEVSLRRDLGEQGSHKDQVFAQFDADRRVDGPTPETLAAALAETHSAPSTAGASWKPWFPVIDFSRCTNCMQCLSFCLFDVYGVSKDQKIQVQHQSNCKTDCPACSRVCPEVAIMFPKYRHGPINGEEIRADDVRREAMKVDISALLGGDIYSMLRDRSVKAKSRFSKERDDERALEERQNGLIALKKDLDIPAEVLASLPSPQEILAKAAAARLRADALTGPRPEPEA